MSSFGVTPMCGSLHNQIWSTRTNIFSTTERIWDDPYHTEKEVLEVRAPTSAPRKANPVTESSKRFHQANAKSMGLLEELEGHSGCVNSIEFSTDGHLLLTGSDDLSFCIYDTVHWTQISKVRTLHNANIFSAVFVPGTNNTAVLSCALDGRTILSSLDEERQQLSTAVPLYRTPKFASRIVFLEGDPNVAYLGHSDGRVMLVDLRSGVDDEALVQSFYLHKRRIHSVNGLAPHPKNPYVFAAGTDTPFVHLCDVRYLHSIAGNMGSPASLENGAASFLSVGTPVVRGCEGVGGLNFSESGDSIVASYKSHDVFCYDWVRGLQDSSKSHMGGGDVFSSYFGDSDYLAPYTSSDRSGNGADSSSVVMMPDAMQFSGRRNVQTMFKEASFFQNDRFVVTGGDCGNLYVWDREDASLQHRVRADCDIVNGVLTHPNLPCIVACGIDSTTKVFAPTSNIAEKPASPEHLSHPQYGHFSMAAFGSDDDEDEENSVDGASTPSDDADETEVLQCTMLQLHIFTQMPNPIKRRLPPSSSPAIRRQRRKRYLAYLQSLSRAMETIMKMAGMKVSHFSDDDDDSDGGSDNESDGDEDDDDAEEEYLLDDSFSDDDMDPNTMAVYTDEDNESSLEDSMVFDDDEEDDEDVDEEAEDDEEEEFEEDDSTAIVAASEEGSEDSVDDEHDDGGLGGLFAAAGLGLGGGGGGGGDGPGNVMVEMMLETAEEFLHEVNKRFRFYYNKDHTLSQHWYRVWDTWRSFDPEIGDEDQNDNDRKKANINDEDFQSATALPRTLKEIMLLLRVLHGLLDNKYGVCTTVSQRTKWRELTAQFLLRECYVAIARGKYQHALAIIYDLDNDSLYSDLSELGVPKESVLQQAATASSTMTFQQLRDANRFIPRLLRLRVLQCYISDCVDGGHEADLGDAPMYLRHCLADFKTNTIPHLKCKKRTKKRIKMALKSISVDDKCGEDIEGVVPADGE